MSPATTAKKTTAAKATKKPGETGPAKTAAKGGTSEPAAASKEVTAQQESDDEGRQIILIDPALVDRDPQNARTENTAPDKKLKDSVRERGVEDAVSVRPDGNGRYGCFKGWRRVQALQGANEAARAGGRAARMLPAIVRDDLKGAEHDAEVKVLSLIENVHREQQSEKDTAKAYTELALMEMPEAERKSHARALGVPNKGLKALTKVSKLSEAEKRNAIAGDMDLEQMAEFAEVNDVPGADLALKDALKKDNAEAEGGRGHWEHAMARLRQEQAAAKKQKRTFKELRDAGIPVLREPASWETRTDKARPLSDLTTALGNPMTKDAHESCKGHSAKQDRNGHVLLDDEDQPVWHCSDPEQYKHPLISGTAPVKKGKSEEQKRQDRINRAGYKAWEPATTVRKGFVGARAKSRLPEELRQYALSTLVNAPWFYAQFTDASGATADVLELMGWPVPEYRGTAELEPFMLGKQSEINWIFAQVCAAHEFAMRDKKAWMDLHIFQVEYLMLLKKHGYTLSEIELKAVEKHRARFEKHQPKKTEPQAGATEQADTSAAEAEPGEQDDAEQSAEPELAPVTA